MLGGGQGSTNDNDESSDGASASHDSDGVESVAVSVFTSRVMPTKVVAVTYCCLIEFDGSFEVKGCATRGGWS